MKPRPLSPRARRRRFVRRAFRVVVCLAFALATSPRATLFAQSSTAHLAPSNLTSVAEQSNAATVKIKARNGNSRLISNGAGVIVSADGYILTAYHVVRGYDNIRCLTVDGDSLAATVVLLQTDYDIAVLKVAPNGRLQAARFADPETIQAGINVNVIGNPLGLGQSLTHGTVGDVRTVNWDGCRAPLQTVAAPIIEGNSGGGTYDAETGELLGINVAKSSLKDNTGYMVPMGTLVAILDRKLPIDQLVDSQQIYDQLGARLRAVKLVDGKFEKGMLITSVKKGSMAEAAGWVKGDVLVGMDNYKMVDQDAVLYVLQGAKGSANNIRFLMARGDAVDSGSLHLDSSPAMVASATAPERQLESARR